MSEVRLVAQRKQPGVCYALSEDGLELPIVDVTHPAFALELSDAQQRALVQYFLLRQRRFARLPRLLRAALARFHTRGSFLAPRLRRAEGSYLDGMTTYLFKLGAKNLGDYALPIDRELASSLPGLSVRLRLSDMARLLASEVGPQLATERERPLWLLNIAGGPALDSINCLLLLARAAPQRLARRRVTICVLDGDASGPAFGARAVRALQGSTAPLHGLDIRLEHVPYDFRNAETLLPTLERVRAEGAFSVVSSEGGLFEYGSDRDIVCNLRALGELGDASVIGSVTRDDETIRALKLTSTAATRPRGLTVFGALATRAGYEITRSIARPLSDQVVLRPRAPRAGRATTP